jgi:hypothetical protein
VTALYSLYDALVSINVPGDKARAVVDAMERDMTTVLATQSDLSLLRMRGDLGWVRSELGGEIARLRQELGGEIALLRQGLGSEIAVLRQELASSSAATKSEFAVLRQQLESFRAETNSKFALLHQSLTIRLGSMLVGAIGVIYTLLRFGH